jgi:hypothetical protein
VNTRLALVRAKEFGDRKDFVRDPVIFRHGCTYGTCFRYCDLGHGEECLGSVMRFLVA